MVRHSIPFERSLTLLLLIDRQVFPVPFLLLFEWDQVAFYLPESDGGIGEVHPLEVLISACHAIADDFPIPDFALSVIRVGTGVQVAV